jgi:hypothetical protein
MTNPHAYGPARLLPRADRNRQESRYGALLGGGQGASPDRVPVRLLRPVPDALQSILSGLLSCRSAPVHLLAGSA